MQIKEPCAFIAGLHRQILLGAQMYEYFFINLFSTLCLESIELVHLMSHNKVCPIAGSKKSHQKLSKNNI